MKARTEFLTTRTQRRPKQQKETTLMKTKLVRSIMAPLLVACALVTVVAAESAPGEGAAGGKLQGTWEMQLTLTDCAGHVIGSGQSVAIFMAGGTMMESQAPRPQAQKTPGEGVWRHTTDSNYAFRFKYFTFDPQNVFTGWTIIAGQLTVDETGNANAGSATVKIYNTNGNLVATACAEVAGTRFEL
jgi:hypothetical protein